MARLLDSVMTISDLARYLKISKSTLYKLCAEHKVPGQKIGKHWRFSRAVIDGWLARGSSDRYSRPTEKVKRG